MFIQVSFGLLKAGLLLFLIYEGLRRFFGISVEQAGDNVFHQGESYFFISLFHLCLQLFLAEDLVALDIDTLDLDLLLLIHIKIKYHIILKQGVHITFNIHLYVEIAFVYEKLLYGGFGPIDQSIIHDLSADELQVLFNLCLLAAVNAVDINPAEAGLFAEFNDQEDLVSLDLIVRNPDISQYLLLPQLFDGVADFRAGYHDAVAHFKSGKRGEGSFIQGFGT